MFASRPTCVVSVPVLANFETSSATASTMSEPSTWTEVRSFAIVVVDTHPRTLGAHGRSVGRSVATRAVRYEWRRWYHPVVPLGGTTR